VHGTHNQANRNSQLHRPANTSTYRMASRSLVAWTCLLAVLLLLLALGGAPAAEARPGPGFARRRGGLAPRRKPSTNAPAGESVFWATGGGDGAAAFKKAPGLSSVHRKVAAGSNNKPPKAAPTQESGGTISVESLGAAGDGRSDDTKAFQKAWDRACSSAQPAVVVVQVRGHVPDRRHARGARGQDGLEQAWLPTLDKLDRRR
jgi:hypothetical protein